MKIRNVRSTLALLALLPNLASAQGTDIEQVRSTTARLIKMLSEQGVLTRARAEGLLQEVATPAPVAAVPAASTAGAGAAAKAAPVRVSYIPEFVRQELKDELRNEIAAQGLREGWAGPGAVPAWVRGTKVEGDLRTRMQLDRFDAQNAPAVSVVDTNRNRALTLLNTTENRERLRARARLGVTITADDNWSGGVRLTTGNTTDPLSSNQTLGNYGNRYTAAFDRAYVRYRHGDQFNFVAGRFGNPWFGTDVLWANDLGFDGVAAQWTPMFAGVRGFLTAAAMPVQEVELARADKWLFGLQAGADSQSDDAVVRSKFGLGYYHYTHLVGRPNSAGSSLNDFTAPAFAQKGNTYFNISSDSTRPLLALAADYHLVNLTGMVDLESFTGKHLVLTGDFAKNIGFRRNAVSARVGSNVEAQTRAYQLRLAYGDTEISKFGDWQAYFAYKRVERDAVLDAFTDSDLHLGGTDAKGFVLGASMGLGRNAVAAVRWFSADSITGAPLSIDTLHVDLTLRY